MEFKKKIGKFSTILVLLFLISIAHSYSGEKLEQYLEVELKHLEETYRLLNTFAEKIWPGWDNYMNIEFRVKFPNAVFLLVNPRKEVPEGYELAPSRTVHRQKIYLNRNKELPIKLQLPLMGGGSGGMTIRIDLRQVNRAPAHTNEWRISSEKQILLYVHEFFHAFQEKVWEKMRESDGGNRKITVSAEYSTYSEIEGQALLGAYTAEDNTKALEYMKDYIVAGDLKHKYMSPGAIKRELWNSVTEGTAFYSNIKMAMLIKEKGYKPTISQKDDPYFFDFQYADEYIAEDTTSSMEQIKSDTFDTLGRYYTYGAFQCFLFDRFVPGWKKGFFENDRNLDEIMRDFIKLSEEEKKHIAARLRSKYHFDELYAKHGAVIKERDNALDMVKNRKGKKYVVDLGKISELCSIIPRGKSVKNGVQHILPHGIEKMTLGDIELVSKDTPIYCPGIRRLEWVDTEAREEEKGYDLKFEEQVGDVYKNIIFTTKGFTLKAPEVKIRERRNKIRIIVLLSKDKAH